MFGALGAWFTALSIAARIGVVSAAVVTAGVANAAISPPSTPISSPPPLAQAQQAPKESCTPSETTTTETQPVAFEKTTVNDSTTASGKTYVKIAGVDGVRSITYKVVRYAPAGCAEDTKSEQTNEITTPTVTEVTAIGTYTARQPTCSNGSYVNTDGITVCSPSADPSGATARCLDGTYSYSLNHSGTCSHHGGVAQWL